MADISPVMTFPTEIQQIASHRYDQNILAIRTLTSITLVEVIRATPKRSLQVTVIAELDWQSLDANGKAIDIAFNPFGSPELLVVTESGGVVVIAFGGDEVYLEPIESDIEFFIMDDPKASQWHLAWLSAESVLVASDRCLRLLHRKTPEAASTLYAVSGESERITSIEYEPSGSTICISTTEAVLWLDAANTKDILLVWKHERETDLTLTVRTLVGPAGPLTLLSSRQTSLLTTYQLEKHNEEDGLSLESHHPCVIPTAVLSDPLQRRVGLAVIPDPLGKENGESFLVLEAASNFSLFATPLIRDKMSPLVMPELGHDPSAMLGSLGMTSRPDLGPRADRSKYEILLRGQLMGKSIPSSFLNAGP
ncbi:hypothetical protein DL93DRAFT_1406027 [Clavulina sp. PMI_390]|nr:hypothetical protein DL93DRAFT_1406027 [Clavulina sp. PMI_390]